MIFAKLGRFLVYVIFFVFTWVVCFVTAALIGSPLLEDDTSGIVDVLIFLLIFVLPVLASFFATRALAKYWAAVREQRAKKAASISTVVKTHPEPLEEAHPAPLNEVHPAPLEEPHPEPVVSPIPVKQATKKVKKVHVNVKPKTEEPKPPYSHDKFFRYGGADAELLSIDLMDGHQFEHWCAEMLRNLDFIDVEVTPSSGDHGVDILAKKNGVKYAIQCKRYRTDVGNTPVQEVHAGKALYHCHVGAVITNQHFTDGARALAQATDVLLWDREFLKAYLLRCSPAPENERKVNPAVQHCSTANISTADLERLYLEAVNVVLETNQASVSMLQRRMGIGYALAAKLIDMMEERKIVGPFDGAAPRKIFIHPH